MNICICDDNIDVIEELKNSIEEYFSLGKYDSPQIFTFTSGKALLSSGVIPDIAFVDIELNNESGIDVSEKIKELNPYTVVIIVTSYMKYLDDAMRISVFRYISKPVEKARLFKNLDDAVRQYKSLPRKIIIEAEDGIHTIKSDEIMLVKADGRRTKFITVHGSFASTEGIEHWKDILTEECFSIPHRQNIVNLNYVSDIGKETITLRNGSFTTEAYLSKRRYGTFKQAWLSYLEKMI